MDVVTEKQLPRSTPEEQGIPSSAVLDFVAAAEHGVDALHGFVLVRHGHVVAQGAWSPYDLDCQRMVFSLSKSFTSSAVGLAVDEGRLSVDDRVLSLLPDAAPAVISDHLDRLRVRHLLTMTSGHASESLDRPSRLAEDDWAHAILSKPLEYEPGTQFVYNSGASYLLSAIMQRVTGMTLLDYLRPRLLQPLGITDATWDSCPRGVNVGGWGLLLRATEIARFGQLYLQQGSWLGQQLVPRSWVAAATTRQVSNEGEIDWSQGYGYQFWRCRHDSYRGDGAFGQFCLVMPEQDAVLAIVGGLSNMQAVLDLVWEHLLPAMTADALPTDGRAHDRLTQRLATLAFAMPAGEPSSPIASRVSGRTYRAAQPVEAIRLDVSPGECRLSVGDGATVHQVTAGTDDWRLGRTALGPRDDDLVAARATWVDDDTCTMRLCFVQTPFVRTLTLRFDGDQVTMTSLDNLSYLPPEPEPTVVVGRLD